MSSTRGDTGTSGGEGTTSRGLNLPNAVAVALMGVFPFVAVRVKLKNVDDPDAFWHILSGQDVWQRHAIVTEDPFGKFSTNTWVRIDWLSDLLMYASYTVGRLPGVVVMYATLAVLLFITLFVACRQVAPPLVASVVSIAAWMGTTASQGFRPQTISFVLLVVTLIAWERVRRGGGTPWWLVPLGYVWACSHGLWFMGPLVGLVVVVGLAVDRVRPRRELLRLLAVPVASLVVALATPIGPRLLIAPFTVNGYAPLVSEWRPPDVHEIYVAVTVILLALVAVGWAVSTTRAEAADVLLWLMALGWTLLYARTVALGAIIVASLAARSLAGMARLRWAPRSRLERVVAPVAVVLAIALGGLLAPRMAPGAGNMPTPVAEAIRALPARTVVFNDDGAGGWLLLEHRNVDPVLDTRTYLFTVQYLLDYIDALAARPGWQEFVETSGATAAVVHTDEPVAAALVDQLGWSVVDESGGWSVLRAPAAG